MPALETVGQYLSEARRLLQDEYAPSYRYPDRDLVEALNIGLLEARRLRPDLFLPLFDVPFVDTAGTIDTTAKITLDPMRRFPDCETKDNVWPRDTITAAAPPAGGRGGGRGGATCN